MRYFKQETNYTCGCACVRMALSKFTADIPTEQELVVILKTQSNSGTDPEEIKNYFLGLGYEVIEKNDSTIKEVEKLFQDGYAVFLAVSVDVPHFVLYGGHNNNHIKFLDPYFGEVYRQIHKFESEKHRYPVLRWKVQIDEFAKYLPETLMKGLTEKKKNSNKYFMAVRKFSSQPQSQCHTI